MRAVHSTLGKMAAITAYLVAHPYTSGSELRHLLGEFYNRVCVKRSPIMPVSLEELGIKGDADVRVSNFKATLGNLSADEMLCLISLACARHPAVVLELGTFDGNTSLQLASNLPDAEIYTVDLPVDRDHCAEAARNDNVLVASQRRSHLRYAHTLQARNIHQVYGNTLEIDFLDACSGKRPDFIFIDAGHSYECVRNDTIKALAAAAPDAMLVWHDYIHHWPDVYNYLNQLAVEYMLRRIVGTSLVVLDLALNNRERQ